MTVWRHNHDEDDQRALQSRCPHCLAEQYALHAIAFSTGDIPCGACGQKTTPMTRRQWHAAMEKTRRAKGVT